MRYFCIGINDIHLSLMVKLVVERHLAVDTLRFIVDLFKHHQNGYIYVMKGMIEFLGKTTLAHISA